VSSQTQPGVDFFLPRERAMGFFFFVAIVT
jgi:hypothetical protein